MSFRRRDYPELLDGMLTALVGGVSGEAHAFPPPGGRHALEAPPARAVVSVFGARNGAPTRFRLGTDVGLTPDGTALVWRDGGATPDAGTLVQVNYLRRDVPSTLSDLEVGSVARTLTEAFALEIARLYAQMQAVYEAGFLETATGASLDKVVALVGLARIPADRPMAALRFDRAGGATGAVTIPAGTRVIDAEVQVEYATIETVTLAPGQPRVMVEARDLEAVNAPVPAELLTVLPVPIAGIAGVTNPAPARRAAEAEGDAALRARARAALGAAGGATLGALRGALARQGVVAELAEPADRPGVVVVTPVTEGLSPERHEQLLAALEDTRPAGVRIELARARAPLAVDLDLGLVTGAGLAEPARRAAHDGVRAAVTAFFAALPLREDARISRLTGAILAVPGVEDVTILGARAGGTDRLDAGAGVLALADSPTVLGALALADAALPTRADLVIGIPAGAAVPDEGAVTAALEGLLAALTAKATAAAASLGWPMLLLVLPAPVGGGESLTAWEARPEPRPALPGTAGVYTVTLHLSGAAGIVRTLGAAADTYAVQRGERLAPGSVTLSAAGG